MKGLWDEQRSVKTRKQVLSEDLKCRKDSACLLVSGSWFQAEGPWYEKERCPKVLGQKDGIRNRCVSEDDGSGLCGAEEDQKYVDCRNHSEI